VGTKFSGNSVYENDGGVASDGGFASGELADGEGVSGGASETA
jgi:hypothetical protein